MKKHTVKENIFSAILGLIIAGILFAIFHPIAERERAQRRETEKQIVAELRAENEAYEREVAAEKARWEEMETEYNEAMTYIATEDDRLDPEDLVRETEYWDSLELLAAVVEAEAGNQDLTGKRLVVDVVLNRVDSPLFPDNIVDVLEQKLQFTTMHNGAVEEAGWHMQEDDYKAVMMEISGERLDYDIYFFTAGEYNSCGRPAYIHGDHYFSYLSKEAASQNTRQ